VTVDRNEGLPVGSSIRLTKETVYELELEGNDN
jgi:hypothetical protein